MARLVGLLHLGRELICLLNLSLRRPLVFMSIAAKGGPSKVVVDAQTCFEKVKLAIRCRAVSGSLWQSGHSRSCGICLFARLSAVRHFPLRRIQENAFALGTAFALQISDLSLVGIDPWNYILYADAAEYSPEVVHFHLMPSSRSSVKFMLLVNSHSSQSSCSTTGGGLALT